MTESNQDWQQHTLDLHRPLGRTFAVGLLLLITLTALLELVLRQPIVRQALIAPSIGGNHRQISVSFALLEDRASEGPLDCIIVGSSAGEAAISPAALSAGYEAETGRPLRCFNFGIPAFGSEPTITWSEVLAERYHPRFILWPVYAELFLTSGPTEFDWDLPWLETQRGHGTVEGWLVEHSYVYRYAKAYQEWLFSPWITNLTPMSSRSNGEAGYGWGHITATRDVTVPLPAEEQGRIKNYQVSQQGYDALNRFALLESSGVQVVLAEFPLPQTSWAAFANPDHDIQLFVDVVSGFAAEKDLTFILRPSPDILPEDGWADYIHMNYRGAAAYSTWLGHQIGQEVKDGRLPLDPPLTGSK